MAIYFETNDPDGLLSELKKAVKENKIVTWSYDNEGDFTHSTEQWIHQAWIRPRVEVGRLALYILKRKDRVITTEVYGIYHGRFIEMMLSHFDHLFVNAHATAQPEGLDMVV